MPPALHTTLPALIGFGLAVSAAMVFWVGGVDINLGLLVPFCLASALGGGIVSTVRGVRAVRTARREGARRAPGAAGLAVGAGVLALFGIALYVVVYFAQHMHL